MSLILRLLGPFELAAPAAACSRKGQWLLALLALRTPREVDRSWPAGTLWPDTTETQALYNLRRELSRLRRILGPEATRIRALGVRTAGLELAGADVDLLAFDRDAGSADETDLQRAIALYRGPLLEGCTEDWVLEERERRRQGYLRALEALAQRARARGDAEGAVHWLRLATTADPLRESAQRGLMDALARSGAHAAATQAYRELRLRLAAELQTEPAAETQALNQQIRAEAHVRGARATPSRPAKGRVPRPLTPLVGRAEEVGEIEKWLRASRLVTLTGTGGVGKSRLALQAASDLAGELLDGAWFVELAPLAAPELVVPATAAALEVREVPGRPLLSSLVGHLRDRQALLILDNCEHLLEACSRLAETLLRECAPLRILATSRQSLGLAGEVVWRVPSLHEVDAIALFRERSELGSWTAAERPIVAQICQSLDGIPLAIELAAARTKVLTVAQIAERLDDRLQLLTGGSRTALPRHRTLKMTVDWSYQLLDPDEQMLLRRLSVFASGWTLDAAESIHGSDVLELLGQLVDKSLVLFAGRYRLLETVHQYARERLDASGESDATHQRHLEHFVALAEEAEPHIFGGEGDKSWIDQLEAERDNLRAAFDWCQADAGRAEPALRMAASLHWFWFARSHVREGCERMALALRVGGSARLPVRAKALAAAGYLAMWIGDYAAMLPPLQEGLGIARQLGDRRLVAYCLCGLSGAVALVGGDADAARSGLHEAAEVAREQGDRILLMFALYWLGTVEQVLGQLDAAEPKLGDALDMARCVGHRPAIGHILHRLGQCAHLQGDLEKARASYLESLRVLDDAADVWGILQLLDALGRMAADKGHAWRAAELLGAAEALSEVIGSSVLRSDRADHDRAVAAARTTLGEPSFVTAWALGRALPLEAAVALAAAPVPEGHGN